MALNFVPKANATEDMLSCLPIAWGKLFSPRDSTSWKKMDWSHICTALTDWKAEIISRRNFGSSFEEVREQVEFSFGYWKGFWITKVPEALTTPEIRVGRSTIFSSFGWLLFVKICKDITGEKWLDHFGEFIPFKFSCFELRIQNIHANIPQTKSHNIFLCWFCINCVPHNLFYFVLIYQSLLTIIV